MLQSKQWNSHSNIETDRRNWLRRYTGQFEKKEVFIQAPTGVGKTMAAVFPAVKAVSREELGEKIFYLTAKTITRTVASQAFEILRKQDLKMKVITLTAKERSVSVRKLSVSGCMSICQRTF